MSGQGCLPEQVACHLWLHETQVMGSTKPHNLLIRLCLLQSYQLEHDQ
jgi:hypothetical protein